MSDTPRTDEMMKQVPLSQAYGSPITTQLSWSIFARQLERENADLREKLAAREARIQKLVAGLSGFMSRQESIEKLQNEDDLSALREHDAALLEEVAQACRDIADAEYALCYRDDDGFKVAGDTAMKCEKVIREHATKRRTP